MFGTLNENEINEVLTSQVVARIGCHYNDVTYVVPISYAYDGSNIYCLSQDGMKTDMIRHNPKVCLQMDDMKTMADWKSVVCWGEAEELTDPELRTEALQRLADRKLPLESSETTHLTPSWPFDDVKQEEIAGALLKIKITKKTGRYERSVIVSK